MEALHMKCPVCGSTNFQIQIIKKDKQARNTRALLFTFLLVIGISMLIGILISSPFYESVIIGIITSFPILIIERIILQIIPIGNDEFMVCYDCGNKSKIE